MSENYRVITWKELSQRLPYSRQHIARLEKMGRFPPRFPLNPEAGSRSRVGWLEHKVNAWILERAKASGIELPEHGPPNAKPHSNR